MSKLWGGRFKKGLDASAIDFSYSLHFDQVLLPYDVELNKIYSVALAEAGVLTKKELKKLHGALDSVLKEAPKLLESLPNDEDVHSFVERLVVEKVGDLGKKMHSGKSRNDQVATDVRMYAKDKIEEINELMHACFKSLYDFASTHSETVFPGFTHLQIAQPVILGHHVLAYFEKLKRDQNRFVDAYERADFCPLGSAAMAGSNYNINRLKIAEGLGFSDITLNSMDAVSDRDFVFDTLYAASMLTLHLSQFCEELIFWSSSVVGFITIGDEFTTGSSIMPQKKNPDIAELIRGQAGPVLGQFAGLHEMVKGLPLTYNRDLQDDKKLLFTAMDITTSVLACFAKMIPTIKVHQDRIESAMNTGHILATEIADYLAMKGVPFREAHDLVGQMVQLADDNNCQVHELSVDQLKTVSKSIESDVMDRLSFKAAIEQKAVVGGTAVGQVQERLEKIKEAFNW
ncbi:MAG: argininosuccinate lyase [Candidatus Margulisiibacteriota bacterium]|nr:argininosuccinate lyase [Candidatus Margulisiibacteriota bacterium]